MARNQNRKYRNKTTTIEINLANDIIKPINEIPLYI